MGTPGFQAPELFREGGLSRVSFASDVWALGVTLYQMMIGRLPFVGSSYSVLVMSIQMEEPEFPINCQLKPHLIHLLRRMLDKNPTTRITLPETMHHEWVVGGGGGPPEPNDPDEARRHLLPPQERWQASRNQDTAVTLPPFSGSPISQGVENWRKGGESVSGVPGGRDVVDVGTTHTTIPLSLSSPSGFGPMLWTPRQRHRQHRGKLHKHRQQQPREEAKRGRDEERTASLAPASAFEDLSDSVCRELSQRLIRKPNFVVIRGDPALESRDLVVMFRSRISGRLRAAPAGAPGTRRSSTRAPRRKSRGSGESKRMSDGMAPVRGGEASLEVLTGGNASTLTTGNNQLPVELLSSQSSGGRSLSLARGNMNPRRLSGGMFGLQDAENTRLDERLQCGRGTRVEDSWSTGSNSNSCISSRGTDGTASEPSSPSRSSARSSAPSSAPSDGSWDSDGGSSGDSTGRESSLCFREICAAFAPSGGGGGGDASRSDNCIENTVCRCSSRRSPLPSPKKPLSASHRRTSSPSAAVFHTPLGRIDEEGLLKPGATLEEAKEDTRRSVDGRLMRLASVWFSVDADSPSPFLCGDIDSADSAGSGQGEGDLGATAAFYNTASNSNNFSSCNSVCSEVPGGRNAGGRAEFSGKGGQRATCPTSSAATAEKPGSRERQLGSCGEDQWAVKEALQAKAVGGGRPRRDSSGFSNSDGWTD